MNPTFVPAAASEIAKARILAGRGEPLFYAAWDNAVFIHYETDPGTLQDCVPFTLDLHRGRAFVSVVAFTLRNMRPRRGGDVSAWLLKPIATHHFFNVRTYVHHHGERAIYFMREWLSNRLSVALGPITFGLPYRFGKIDYANEPATGKVSGKVSAKDGRFEYFAAVPGNYTECASDSLTEFLLERYTAFTSAGWRKQFFRVWHRPWEQTAIKLELQTDDLMATTGPWWEAAHFHSANYSPGVQVWMGWPHPVEA